MTFTKQETLQDALIAHKFLMHMYCQFGLECSNKQLRTLFEDLNKTVSDHELKIFKIMNKEGFYPTTPAPCAKVKQTLKMHTQMQEKLTKKIK